MKSIYKIINKINNKIYIGLTIQGVRTRFLHHLYEARSGTNFPIHNAIAKYGEENFTIETIFKSEDCTDYLLKDLEKHYIRLYASNIRDKGYNLTEGGDGTLGRFHSDETKDKIRQKAIGRKMSEETKKRMKESALKRTGSSKFKEWKDKWSKGNMLMAKKIVLEKNGILYKFESISECNRVLGLSKFGIRKLINNEYTEYKGYNKISA